MSMEFVPLPVFEAPSVIKDCFDHQTFRPYAIGIFGSKNRHIGFRTNDKGAMYLPTFAVRNPKESLTTIFDKITGKQQPAEYTGYAMYDSFLPEAISDLGFSNGCISFLMKATVDNIDTGHPFDIAVPASEVVDVLQQNYNEYRYTKTEIAQLAIAKYAEILAN